MPIPDPGSTRFYREAKAHLSPDQLLELHELIRAGANSDQMYEWFIGLATDDTVEDLTQSEDLSAEALRLTTIINRKHELEMLATDPTQIPPEKHMELLRFLAYQLEKSMPEMADEQLQSGDAIVSFTLTGIKELNDHHVGITTAAEIVDYFHTRLEITLREHGITGITILPTQQIWKRYSLKVDRQYCTDLESKIADVQQTVEFQVQAYIDERSDIQHEVKERIKTKLLFNTGIAHAQAQEPIFDVWQESVVRSQINDSLDSIKLYKNSIRSLNLPEFSIMQQLLNQEIPTDPKECAEYLFQLAQVIRIVVSELFKKYNLEKLLTSIPDEEQTLGFSQYCFGLIRGGKAEEFVKQTEEIKSLDVGQRMQLMNLIKIYGEILASPLVIKSFTLDDLDSQMAQCQNLRELYSQTMELIKRDTTIQIDDQPALTTIQKAVSGLKYDQRFGDEQLTGPFTSTHEFDAIAVGLHNPIYLSLDVVGVGSKYLETAQAIQIKINQAGNDYESIRNFGKTMGEDSWRMIEETFAQVSNILQQNPDLKEYFTQNQAIPATIKGDELVIVLPSNVDQNALFASLQQVQETLTDNTQFGTIRLTIAQTNREDISFAPVQVRVQEHIKARILAEKEGIHIAKVFEGLQTLINSPIVVEVTEKDPEEIMFRLLYNQHQGQNIATSNWYSVQILHHQNEIDMIKQEILQTL